MSASTVSITANPTTRRRPVEKRSTNIELVSAEHQSQRPDDQTNRDLSHHTIRSETAVDRSAQTKRTAVTSTVSPPSSRRTRAAVKRPRWLRFLRIFGKWFGLLVFVGGLGQILMRLAYGPSAAAGPMAFTDLEGRIAEVEASMKETSRMLQVGVDVASRKVGELKKEVEEREVAFGNELRKLEAKSEGLERSVEELKSVEWMTKQEFERIYEELNKEEGKSGGDGELGASLDEIMAYAKNVVEKEIEKHAADGLAKVDYALGSGGAAVVKHSEPYVVGKGNWWTSLRNGVHSDADKMLRPSFGEPGQCFPLKGSSGFVQIKLRTAIIPEAITLEHVSKNVAYDRKSAPKDCRVSAWLRGVHDQELEVHTEKMFLLAEFTYDLEKSNAQTVTVLDSAVSNIVDTVRLDFTSNHGSPSHTCIYRLRVHGHEPESVSVMTMQ